MDNVKVYYDVWQMMCCGDPFTVGEEVEWSVFMRKRRSDQEDLRIDFFVDRHYHSTDGMLKLRGKVERILLEYSDGSSTEILTRENGKECKFTSHQKEKLLYKEISYADGYDENELPDGYSAWGYLVTLSNVVVRGLEENSR